MLVFVSERERDREREKEIFIGITMMEKNIHEGQFGDDRQKERSFIVCVIKREVAAVNKRVS